MLSVSRRSRYSSLPASRPRSPTTSAMRNAEQLGVGELDARARVAVVVQHLDAGGGELGVQPVGCARAHASDFCRLSGTSTTWNGRDRLRPDDAALIVVLLDRGGDDARHTDAVAAHEQRDFLARLIEHVAFIALAVLAAELEDVADLDAARDPQRALAGGARDRPRPRCAGRRPTAPGRRGPSSRRSGACPSRWRRRRSPRARARCGRRTTRHLRPDRADEAGLACRSRAQHALGAGHAQRARDARQLLRLDGVQLVIAAQHAARPRRRRCPRRAAS